MFSLKVIHSVFAHWVILHLAEMRIRIQSNIITGFETDEEHAKPSWCRITLCKVLIGYAHKYTNIDVHCIYSFAINTETFEIVFRTESFERSFL